MKVSATKKPEIENGRNLSSICDEDGRIKILSIQIFAVDG